jgi:formylglycine-generating enzyme required for sulfatase activity
MEYPWGDELPSCYHGALNGAYYDGCGVASFQSVGFFAPNGFGLYDMAGNVWEWVADWYWEDYYSSYTLNDWPDNPLGPSSLEKSEIASHFIRGGGGENDPYYLRVTFRGYLDSTHWLRPIGFRCVTPVDK